MKQDEPIRILVVDDHQENLVAMEALIAPLGHEVVLADSGRAALRHLLAHEVALVLLDVAMPDLDGYEVAQLIRNRLATRDTPIIFLTADLKSTSAVFKGYASGAVDYLFKPVSPDILLSKVNVFVDLYRRSRDLKRQREDLRQAHTELDARVRERTDELAQANERLKGEVLQRRRAEKERAELLRREQKARQEAERLNRTKDEFLATLSHELRTPLNAILGWAHLLDASQPSPETLTRGVRVIKNNAFAQQQLIEDILDVSRIVNGKLTLKLSPVPVREVIEAALDTLRPAADAKRIDLVTQLEELPPMAADRDRLQQVVWNLLSNAIKFTPKEGRVEVRLDSADSDARIRVTDSGKGIPAGFLPHIFDRFSQADSSLTRTHGGLGLGMAIVRHLVELHGGTVQAESEGEDRGATFTVTLPVREYRDAGEAPRRPAAADVEDRTDWAALPRLDGTAILVVDNEVDARQIAAAILQHQGALVLEAASGHEALDLLGRERVDIVVSDIAMPTMDGLELIRRIRQAHGDAMPAIALSARAAEADVAESLAAGYQHHLVKPINAASLILDAAELARGLISVSDEGLPANR